MIPALPCGTYSDGDIPAGAFYVAAFEDGDDPHHVGEYRIETVLRALRALQACGNDDVEIGSIERGGRQHLLLIGLDGEARFGDRQLGCIVVCPVVVDSRGRYGSSSTATTPRRYSAAATDTSRTCGTCQFRDPGNLCLIVYRTVRGNKPACEHWQEAVHDR